MKKFFYNPDDSGKVFLWCLVIPQVLGIFASIILLLIANSLNIEFEEFAEELYVNIPFLMVSQLAFFLIFNKYSKNYHNAFALKLNAPGKTNTLICIVIAILCLFGFSFLSSCFEALGEVVGIPASESFYYEMNSVWLLLLSIICFAIVPAVLEELIFRGIIFQGLKGKGLWPAMLLTSLLFALIHGSASQLLYPFVASMVMCYVVYKTNSLFSSIIIHAVSNTISILLVYLNFQINIDVSWAVFSLIAIFIAAASLALIWLLTKKLKKAKNSEKAEKQKNMITENDLPIEHKSNKYMQMAIIFGILFFALNVISVITAAEVS